MNTPERIYITQFAIEHHLYATTQSAGGEDIEYVLPNSSGFKGVSWDAKNAMWRSQIHVGKKSISIGRFKDKKEAALAYDDEARQRFGEFAHLNFKVERL